MNITESLTLENFWNELKARYPEGLKIFTDWIDEYKKTVDWDKLFNGRGYPIVVLAPKYHELPYAFQLGIWLEFIASRKGEGLFRNSIYINPNLFSLKHHIGNYVAAILQREAENKLKQN